MSGKVLPHGYCKVVALVRRPLECKWERTCCEDKTCGEDDIIEAATVEVSWGGEIKIKICQVYRKQNDVENTVKLLEYLARLPDQTVTVGD